MVKGIFLFDFFLLFSATCPRKSLSSPKSLIVLTAQPDVAAAGAWIEAFLHAAADVSGT